jgi:peptidoglycan/LPS O-acetylase OafA/YrhL
MEGMNTLERRQSRRNVDRRIGMLMAFEAATLAVAAAVHLAGYTPAGSKPPFEASHAGVAEAIIGVVLACGAIAVLRSSSRAWAAAVATTSFAILGFVVGLTITTQGGDVPDVAYHVIMLPILIFSLIVLARTGRGEISRGLRKTGQKA